MLPVSPTPPHVHDHPTHHQQTPYQIYPTPRAVTEENLDKYVGKRAFTSDRLYDGPPPPGVVMGRIRDRDRKGHGSAWEWKGWMDACGCVALFGTGLLEGCVRM